MLITRFRVWLQDSQTTPVWAGVQIVDSPEYIKPGCLDVKVEGNGHDLRRLIAKRRDIFAAYLQMKPAKSKDH